MGELSPRKPPTLVINGFLAVESLQTRLNSAFPSPPPPLSLHSFPVKGDSARCGFVRKLEFSLSLPPLCFSFSFPPPPKTVRANFFNEVLFLAAARNFAKKKRGKILFTCLRKLEF